MENDLAQNQSIYQLIVESAPNAMLLVNADGRIKLLNKQAEILFGYSRVELQDKPIELLLPERYKAQHPDFSKMFFGNPSARAMGAGRELFALRKDGKEVPVEIGLNPIASEEPLVLASVIDISERKKTEARFKALFEHNIDVIVMLDANGITTYASPSTEAVMGYKPAEILGLNGNIHFHPDEMEIVYGRMQAALQNPGKAIYTQNRIRHKDGHYIYTEGTTTNFLEDENINAFVGTFRDITDRKIAEDKLDKSEKRFRALIEYNAEIITLRDKEGNLFYISPGAEKTMGYSLDELRTIKFESLFHPEDSLAVENRFKESISKPGMPIYGVQRIKHYDGHYIWLEGTITNFLNDEIVAAVVGNFRDITDRKKADDKLEQNEKRFRALIENNFDAISLYDEIGNIVYQSPAVERITGYTIEERSGMTVHDFAHPEDLPLLLNRLDKAINNPGKPIFGMNRMRCKDGRYIWTEGTTTNLLHDKNVAAMVGNFRDITDRKDAEERILIANRIYAFISAINQAIAHNSDEQTLFTEVCRIAVQIGKFDMAFITQLDFTLSELTVIAGYNIIKDDLEKFDKYTFAESGLIDYLIKNGKYSFINDYESPKYNIKTREYIYNRGYNSGIALSIRKGGTIAYSFHIFSHQKNIFDSQELNLLSEITDDLSFALDVFEKEKLRKEAEAKLKHNELRLQQAQAIAHIGSWEEDFLTGSEIWSEEACRIYGLAPEDNQHNFESWFAFIHPDDREYVLERVKSSRIKLTDTAIFHRIITRDGRVKHIYSQSHFEFNSDGIPIGKYGVTHDVTDQKEAEEKIIHANRLYAFISQINQVIVRSTDQQIVFDEVCRIAIEFGKFMAAWIGILDESGKLINLAAQCNMTVDDIALFTNYEYDINGIQGIVIRSGKSYVSNHIIKDPILANRYELTQTRGWRSCMILPIKKSGIVVGTLNILSDEINFFDKSEINLLEESANDISFALDNFEKDQLRIASEKNLQHSESRFKQAQAIAHIGSWELDFRTGLSKWSDESCAIYGLPNESSVSSHKEWESFVHPEDLGLVRKANADLDKNGSASFYHRIIRSNGEIRYVYSQSSVEYDKHGVPIGLFGAVHDITDTRKAEDALALSENNLRLIMDLIPQAVCARDIDGKYIFANKNYAKMYGFAEPDQMIRQNIRDVIPVKNESVFFQEMDKEVILTRKQVNIPEHNFTDANNNIRICNTVKIPLIVAGPNILASLSVTNDITEQKLIEAERTKMVADIIQRNKDLEQFSYIVSHNLRAPVANIRGLAEILQFPDLNDDDKYKIISDLDICVVKLDEVIIDLNYVLQIKSKQGAKKESVKCSNILKDIIASIDSIIKSEGVSIITNFTRFDELYTLKSYVYSIFLNLITNSIKYRQSDLNPIIEISSDAIGNTVIIKYKDNGLGIDLGKRSNQVFGLYKRFHDHVDGKGMGLFMVKTQVESLGGKISITSEVNKGTEFIIELDINQVS